MLCRRGATVKLRDPGLLEKRCRVCAWSVDGCPGCWKPASRMRAYNKHGGDKAFKRVGGKADNHGAAGSFAASAVTHTKQTDRSTVFIHRRTLCYVNIYVKTVPAGAIYKLRLESGDSVAYMLFQFRMQCGDSGLDDTLVRLLSVSSSVLDCRCV